MILDKIFGDKTTSFFDVWSIQHFVTGIAVGWIVIKINEFVLRKYFPESKRKNVVFFDVILVLLGAVYFEIIEHYLEIGEAGKDVEEWAKGVEFWGNRIITDPLMLVLGYFVVRKWPKLAIPGAILSVIWFVVHVKFFPHSMYLQEILQ